MDTEKQKNGAGQSAASTPVAQQDIREIITAPDTLQAAALHYAGRGVSVFPCKPRKKTPLTTHGFKDASAHPDKIAFWWGNWPDANIGLPTGEKAGFWVLDIDVDKGGEESLRALEEQYGALPQSLEVITGSGGRHIYFKWPEDAGIANSAGGLGTGLDVRGSGGYAIAPPSVHPCGGRYEWSVDSENRMQPAPAWLLDLVRKPAEGTRGKTPQDWRALSRGVSEGQRNDAIARLSGKLFRCDFDPYTVLEFCQWWNARRCTPPLPEEEVTRTVNSIAGKELEKRRNGA